MRKNLVLVFLTGMVVSLGFVIGCSDSDSVSDPQSGEGTIQVRLIDAPGDFEAVNIEVVEVQVHRNEDSPLPGWHTINSDTTRVDLLELSAESYAVLADTTLPAGHYTQVRLMLSENNSVVVNGETYPLQIPSSSESGLKLNHGFDLHEGVIHAVTLDFDADRSIHKTGNSRYKMIPVIRLVVDKNSGSLSGAVEPVEARAMVRALAGEDTVIVYADTLSGDFSFSLMMAGSYNLEFTATMGAFRDTTLSDIVVAVDQNTDVGTVMLEAE